MLFKELNIKGVYVIEPELRKDERGFFARSWCKNELESAGLNPNVAQCNISFNKKRGTVRGMHYQAYPYWEVKIVRCIKGAIYDVIVDMRPNSESYGKWVGVELTQDNHKALYVPVGFMHGFQTLEDDSEVMYQVSEFYTPEFERGARWNDSYFNIKWPLKVSCISEKDAAWPLYEPYSEADEVFIQNGFDLDWRIAH